MVSPGAVRSSSLPNDATVTHKNVIAALSSSVETILVWRHNDATLTFTGVKLHSKDSTGCENSNSTSQVHPALSPAV